MLTPAEYEVATLVLKQTYYWILLNAKESGWFETELPLEMYEKIVARAAREAIKELICKG